MNCRFYPATRSVTHQRNGKLNFDQIRSVTQNFKFPRFKHAQLQKWISHGGAANAPNWRWHHSPVGHFTRRHRAHPAGGVVVDREEHGAGATDALCPGALGL